MQKKPLIGILICMLLIVSTIIPVSATTSSEKTSQPLPMGNTLYVGGSGPNNYTKIQDAIDAAEVGDTVYIFDDSSPYYEDINISKAISLVGENRKTTVIDGGGTPRFEITGENITVKNLTIRQGNIQIYGINILIKNIIIPGGPGSVYAIYLYHCSKIKILNSTIQGSTYGIFAFFGQRLDVQGNNFINNFYNANFQNMWFTHWARNYWYNWDGIGPYAIPGAQTWFNIPWRVFDWHPAREPYDI